MKKRVKRILALLLSLTMVCTMNAFVFAGTEGDSSEEGEEVSIEKMVDDAINNTGEYNDYIAAFAVGSNDGLTDSVSDSNANNKAKNGDKVYEDYSERERAGYNDGYAASRHITFFGALQTGFYEGLQDGVYGGKYDERVAANDDSKVEAPAVSVHPTNYLFYGDKGNDVYRGETWMKGYQSGYKSGWDTGVDLRNAYAKEDAEDYFDGTEWFTVKGNPLHAGYQFTNGKPYSSFETDGYKNRYKSIDDEDYGTEYKKAWHEAYDGFYKDREAAGEEAGKNDGILDGRDPLVDKNIADATVSEDDAKAIDAKGLAKAGTGEYEIEGYENRWKTFNNKFEADDDGYNAFPVNESFIKGYIKGYKEAFVPEQKAAKEEFDEQSERDAYLVGFRLGFNNGQTDGENNNKKADEAAKNDDPAGAWYQYVSDTDNHSSKEITAFKNGYKAGYDYAFKDMSEEDGYMLGYDSGFEDGVHDRYGDTRWVGADQVEGGFYEPDYEDSAYRIFEKSGSNFGKGYIAGYMDGYKTGLAEEANDRTVANAKPFDYSAADMNTWRISSDPATWDTAQLMIWESAVPQDADKVGENLFFDTKGLTDSWQGAAPSYGFKNKDASDQVAAGRAGAEVVATSPFQYYFDLYSHDHLVDKVTVSPGSLPLKSNVYVNDIGINNGSIGQYLYRAIPVGGETVKPRKLPDGTEDTGKPYVIVRYRIADAETDENYKVIRYSYDINGGESRVIDSISDYYSGSELGNEPVVEYDSRKIAGMKPENPKGKYKANNHVYNDKSTRNAIDVEALLISWTEGSPARLIGRLNLDVTAKNNVAASLPHTYITFTGDTETENAWREMPSEYFGGQTSFRLNYLKQTDKSTPAGVPFSRYYKVTEENLTGEKVKANRAVVAFAAPLYAEKLTNADNAYLNKKGESPSFTLKMKKADPMTNPYSKDVKKALKNSVFNFEISRMKIASDYDTHMEDATQGNNEHYTKELRFEDTKVISALIAKFVPAPKRSEYNSLAEYEEAVKNYITARRLFDGAYGYTHSDEFKELAVASFKEYVAAYKAQYNALVSQYGAKLDYFRAWIADEENGWASNAANRMVTNVNNGAAVASFPYTVTENDRTDNTAAPAVVVPVSDTVAYRTMIPEDANCDGLITAEEHYIYVNYVGPDKRYKDQFDPAYKTSALQAGDNILGFDDALINGEIDYDDLKENGIGVVVAGDSSKVDHVVFNFQYEVNGDRFAGTAGIAFDEEYGKYYYYQVAFFAFIPAFDIYVDFLEDQPTDIELIEKQDMLEDTVLYPGGQNITVFSGVPAQPAGQDTVTIDFTDPKVKSTKKEMSMMVTPLLITRVNTADPDPTIVEKKLKTSVIKSGAAPKPGKADIQLEQKMANTEPFIVATGINNYEGSIAMRQRQNGDIGYGYFKNDDFYYIFNDEK